MDLKKLLQSHGYDLIDGPVRNHRLLQLWLKKDMDRAELYYNHLTDAFKGSDVPEEVVNTALKVSSSDTDEYQFNIGITVLEGILKSIGLGEIGLSAKIKSGKKVTISYGDSTTREVPIGEIENYLASADFTHPNPVLLRNARRDNILIVTGLVIAKDLTVKIETDFKVDAGLVASLESMAAGKAGFTSQSDNMIDMQAPGNEPFPVAVKASRIGFRDTGFNNLKLVTDNRADLF
jgi:hypothetical protein